MLFDLIVRSEMTFGTIPRDLGGGGVQARRAPAPAAGGCII